MHTAGTLMAQASCTKLKLEYLLYISVLTVLLSFFLLTAQ